MYSKIKHQCEFQTNCIFCLIIGYLIVIITVFDKTFFAKNFVQYTPFKSNGYFTKVCLIKNATELGSDWNFNENLNYIMQHQCYPFISGTCAKKASKFHFEVF